MKKLNASILANLLFGAMTSMAQACPDPAVVSLKINKALQQPDGHWQLDVTGVIRNEGRTDFISASELQNISLSISRYGPRGVVNSILLKEKISGQGEMSRLPAGASQTVSYQGTLNILKGENARPRLKLAINYDPVVYNDSSTANDDCQSDNNEHSSKL